MNLYRWLRSSQSKLKSRRRKLFAGTIESLEERRMLANLRITSASLIDANLNPITQPVIGQSLRLKMDFITEGLPVGSNYTLAWSIQGVELTIGNIDWGGGFASANWYATNFGWFAESGAVHTAQVRVDRLNTVAETDETDNTFSFTFTPVSAVLPVKLSWPETGTLGVDRSLTNYLDLDPTSGLRDFTGGKLTYDGHQGIDTGGSTNLWMDFGIPIIVAAPGTVIEAVDGNFDRNRGTIGNIVPGGPANYVAIDHGGGLVTYYLHMRRDTVRVKVGDVVARGQVLGLEGSSGDSTATHLHFAVNYNTMPVETYLDPTAYWENAPPWIMTSRSILESGITNYDPLHHLAENVSNMSVFTQAAGQRVYVWGIFSGVRQGDAVRAIFKRPNGTVYSNLFLNSTQDWSASYWYYFTNLPAVADVGTWTVDLLAGIELLKTLTFEVAAAGQPEVRVEEADPQHIVLDERSTPFDFGSPETGATAPAQTFRVVNHGTAPLLIQDLQAPEGFTITEGLPAMLAAGQSDTFNVSMLTSGAGYKAGQIRLFTNDLDEAETNFAVEGKVLAALPQLKLGIGLRHATEGDQVIANVSRTGSTGAPLTVSLISNDVTEATVPISITIPAGASRTTFLINTLQDSLLDPKQIVTLTASAVGFASAINTLDVEDNPALAMVLSNASISEKSGTTTVTLTRSFTKLWKPLTVQLSSSQPTAISMPTTISFAANEQSVTFNVTAIDNNTLDGTRVVNLNATTTSHGSAAAPLSLIDEEHLVLEIDKNSISEKGGQATVTIRRTNTNISLPLTVALSLSQPSQASVAANVTLPAGVASVSVPLDAMDDSLLDGAQSVLVEASAAGYLPATSLIVITDYELLEVSIDVPSISENGGVAIGTVRRTNSDIGQTITVQLYSSNITDATVPETVIIPAGQATAQFMIHAVDDAILSGNTTVTISATFVGYATGSSTLQILDVERLLFFVDAPVISERGGTSIVSVRRTNTGSSSPLTVNLSNTDPEEVNIPLQVTIPAFQESIAFTISGVDDDLLDGDQTVTIQATAPGYVSGSTELIILDYEELLITAGATTISEREGATVGRVTRGNTDINLALQVTLVNNDDTRLNVPSQLTIPAGQSFTEFPITANDDDLLNGAKIIGISSSADGYVSTATNIEITDWEATSITLDSTIFSERGGSTTGTITRNNIDVSAAISFTLTSSDNSEAIVPATVTILAGEHSATFTVQSVDDGLLDGEQLVTITAAHPAYESSETSLAVSDWEELSLSVLPASISENNGTATVRVSRTNIDNSQAVVVQLLNDAPDELAVEASISIPANLSFVEFTISGVDDDLLDGPQNVRLTASAIGYVAAQTSVTVIDAEKLVVTLQDSRIDEAAGATQGTVTRSNVDIQLALTVQLTSSSPSQATVPATVTIPAGQTFVTFAVQAVDDELLDGVQSIEILAMAVRYIDGTAELLIDDDESLTPWRNPRNDLDVDNSGAVVPLDALLLINSLNTEGARQLPSTLPSPFEPARYWDCSGDGFLSAIDALLVINYLNLHPSGESEATASKALAIDLALLDDNYFDKRSARRLWARI